MHYTLRCIAMCLSLGTATVPRSVHATFSIIETGFLSHGRKDDDEVCGLNRCTPSSSASGRRSHSVNRSPRSLQPRSAPPSIERCAKDRTLSQNPAVRAAKDQTVIR